MLGLAVPSSTLTLLPPGYLNTADGLESFDGYSKWSASSRKEQQQIEEETGILVLHSLDLSLNRAPGQGHV